jgi:predicted DNA-binding transcriptional regulator YafY
VKLNRLIEMIVLLLNYKTITAHELAKRFDVHVRTIYRDIEDLSVAGIPVYMVKGRGGGISLLEEYRINSVILSESDRVHLTAALKAVQSINSPEIETVIEKIGAVFRNTSNDNWVNIDFMGWSSTQKDRDKFTDIKNAIMRNQVIGFDYINGNGEKSSRMVEPEQLYFNRYTWYLLAFCRNRKEHRIFRISRIKNVTTSREQFEKRVIGDEEYNVIRGDRLSFLELHLRFSARMLYRIYDEFDEESITKNEDGTIDVRISMPEDDWMYGFILSFGPFVEVVSPERIRREVADSMRAALAFYS